MNKFFRFFVVTLFFISPLVGYSQDNIFGFEDDKTSVQLTINGEKFVVQSLPQDGIAEVFNILGSKVMSFNIKGGTNVNRITLPEGYYILKSENVTKKIVVK